MGNIYIKSIKIDKVRHLRNILLPISENEKKHIIFTGKNGSGKTSVLEAIAGYLQSASTEDVLSQYPKELRRCYERHTQYKKDMPSYAESIKKEENNIKFYNKNLEKARHGIDILFNYPVEHVKEMFTSGNLVLAHYRADRTFQAEVPKHVEKVELQENYQIYDAPRRNFVKYLLDLKMTEALAAQNGKSEKADQIKLWFDQLQNLLARLFEDDSTKLVFDEETFTFRIEQAGREPFDFNTLSSGYAAVLDIIVDIIIRMEKQTHRSFHFDVPGIVLVDEIETHLHLALQKNVLKLLTAIFPNIQFIISTHSPFILNSLENVVIYDLEKHLLVKDGLADVPYDGIVEGYFNADVLSDLLKTKFNRYKELVRKDKLSDDDFEEIAGLEMYLEEIPDYLALDLTTEYQRVKAEFENREDL